MPSLLLSEDGQDMVEYTLLLGFIALAGAAVYLTIADNIDALWSIVNDRMNSASE